MAQERLALVTGGAGFIGSHLCEGLVSAGWRVRALDDLSSGHRENLAQAGEGVEFLRGDVRDAETVARAMAGVEVVFHEAALASVPLSVAEPLRSEQVNSGGTLRVLEAARQAGVRRLVFAASSAVYGEGPELPKRESLPPDPRSPYALQKHVGELYCRLYFDLYGLETVALRYFNIFGPRQDPDGDYAAVIPKFVSACVEGRPPVIFGDGEQTRDFASVSDVVRANLLAAEAPDAAGSVCNVGSGRATSLNELLAAIQRLLGTELVPEHRSPRAGDVRHSLACIDAARERLGFRPAVDLEAGLRPTIAHFEKAHRRTSRGAS